MGVPAFFRWLSRKYPSIIHNAQDEKPQEVDGVTVPVDCSKPNPNGVEFDNLYLDMNGIIHPCCHPEDRPAPKTEDDMMVLIFEYIDRLFRIVRPRRVLYMAIDGVAPRAKMNQQRSRRFRAAKDAVDKRNEINKVRQDLEMRGIPVPPPKAESEHFDSNCITPGTPFMANLAVCLRYFVHDRLNNDPAWANIQVILSDANVPGEGEHKIMDYIRRQRGKPSHDPNTQHCLCGADADLIMLGLATHEPNFTILRDEFVPHQQKPCDLCGQYGHELKNCEGGIATEKTGEYGEVSTWAQKEKNHIFVRLAVLREYLRKELFMDNLPFPFDIERAIDDWVFMCFFVGNDFLPHLPSLEIREGAIDRLIKLYKTAVYRTGGYLTDSGFVNLQRVQLILSQLGEVEDDIFRRRQDNELNFRRRNKDKKRRERAATAPASIAQNSFAPVPIGSNPMAIPNPKQTAYEMRRQAYGTNATNADAAKNLKKVLGGGSGEARGPEGGLPGLFGGRKRKHDAVDDVSSDEEPQDDVRLYEAGWKERYYQAKFEVSEDDVEFRQKVSEAYVEGLCWVLRYYYQGCCSWKWFFPFHYAPFASDFHNIGDLKIEFTQETKPFFPLEQLMGVFPAASRAHLPPTWRPLMTEPESPIIDFYPDDFQIDLNGKKFAWQGVALLPFVEEQRLLSAVQNVYPKITAQEKFRNQLGKDRLFVSGSHKGFAFLRDLAEGTQDNENDNGDTESPFVELDPDLFSGMSGKAQLDPLAVMPGQTVPSPIEACQDLPDNRSIGVSFLDPEFPKEHVHKAKRLPGAKEPPTSLKPEDWNSRNQGRYRPQFGFNRGGPQASMGQAGKRMINAGLGQYSNMAPPQEFNGRGRGGGGYRGGRGGGYRGRDEGGRPGGDQRNHQRSNSGYGGGGYGGGQWNSDRYGGGGGGGGGYGAPVHWQGAMRNQGSAYGNNQERGGYGRGGGGPQRGNWTQSFGGSYGGGRGRGGNNFGGRPAASDFF